jgi:hypothetical protein
LRSNKSNRHSIAPALVSVSRKVQIVLASGTASPSPRPRKPVAEIELGALVAQVVLRLQDQNLEHQDVIKRRAPALAAVGPRHGALELGPEQLEVDHRGQPFEVVALLGQPRQALLDVEQPGRTPHPDPPLWHAKVEQIRPVSPGFWRSPAD